MERLVKTVPCNKRAYKVVQYSHICEKNAANHVERSKLCQFYVIYTTVYESPSDPAIVLPTAIALPQTIPLSAAYWKPAPAKTKQWKI